MVEQYVFSNLTWPAFGAYRQILNIKQLQYRLKSELSDDFRVCRMCLNNLSVYTGDGILFSYSKKRIFHSQQAPKLISFTFEHPVYLCSS